MQANLNIQTPHSWCYADQPELCEREGRLYAWSAAQAACPAGWRLPNDSDWLALIQQFGGYYLLAERRVLGDAEGSYQALTNGGASGLAFRLSGWRDTTHAGRSEDLNEDGLYWSASRVGPDSANLFVFNRHFGRVLRDRALPDFAASVRCIRL